MFVLLQNDAAIFSCQVVNYIDASFPQINGQLVIKETYILGSMTIV